MIARHHGELSTLAPKQASARSCSTRALGSSSPGTDEREPATAPINERWPHPLGRDLIGLLFIAKENIVLSLSRFDSHVSPGSQADGAGCSASSAARLTSSHRL